MVETSETINNIANDLDVFTNVEKYNPHKKHHRILNIILWWCERIIDP